MTTFVTVGPEYNGGMVSVPHHHLFDKLLTDGCTVRLLLSGEFIEHIPHHSLSILKKLFIRGIICTEHGIYVHFFDKLHITMILSLINRPVSLRSTNTAFHTFHFHFHVVDFSSITITKL